MPDKYEQAEAALRILNAKGHLVASHDKNPLYPAKDWQMGAMLITRDVAMDAWRKWGDVVRGVGVVMYDNLVVLDFDPMEKTEQHDPEMFAVRKEWRDKKELQLLKGTYAEKSRSGRGSHYIFKVSCNFAGRRGIELLKRYYAIDFLTHHRYCDITGDRLNDLEPFDGTGVLYGLLDKIERSFVDIDPRSRSTIPPGTYSIECIAELLQHVWVDPEDYAGWLEIGFALYRETNGGNDGLNLWDQWSRAVGGEKYKGFKSVEYKWSTFRPEKQRYTVGSIIKRAQSGGANVTAILLKHRGGISEVARTMVFAQRGK